MWSSKTSSSASFSLIINSATRLKRAPWRAINEGLPYRHASSHTTCTRKIRVPALERVTKTVQNHPTHPLHTHAAGRASLVADYLQSRSWTKLTVSFVPKTRCADQITEIEILDLRINYTQELQVDAWERQSDDSRHLSAAVHQSR